MRGSGRVFKRGSIWWISYYHNGREQRESSKSRDQKVAVRLLRQRLGELALGAGNPVSVLTGVATRVVMMEELFDLVEHHYQLNGFTSPTNGCSLRRMREHFDSYTVEGCNNLVIKRYMATRQKEGRKPETINREVSVLRVAFRLGYEDDLVQRIPVIRRLPEIRVRNEFFTREEIDTLLPHLPEYLRDLVLFGFLTGWRKGEILGLRWDNVDRSEAVIRLDPVQNKGRTVRILTLRGELTALIERRWDARTVGQMVATHVFHRGGHPANAFRRAWLKACQEAGLGSRLFHSLRRSAARNMSLKGIPEKVIMSIMGHKTRAMFDRYNIISESDQRAYAERLFGP